MKKDSMIIALVVLAVFVVLALVWQSIPAAREVTVDDYATDQHGSYLARWGVYYYEVIGADTTLVDMDTTDSYGWYEITAPTGSYLIYAFPLWDDSTDTSLSRKSFMNKQTIVAVDNDTAFFRFVAADSDFVGNITGNITGTADSAVVAATAWGPEDDDWIVTDTIRCDHLRVWGAGIQVDAGNIEAAASSFIIGLDISAGKNITAAQTIRGVDIHATDSLTAPNVYADTAHIDSAVVTQHVEAERIDVSEQLTLSHKRKRLKQWDTKVMSTQGRIPFVMSFDDGFDEQYAWAESLKVIGVPATFFVVRNWLGTANWLTWAQVCSLYAWGHDVGAHSLTHMNFKTLYEAGDVDTCWFELEQAQIALQDTIQKYVDPYYRCESFAWPYGSRNPALTGMAAELFSVVRKAVDAEYHSCLESFHLYDIHTFWTAKKVLGTAEDTTEIYANIDSLITLMVDNVYAWGSTHKFYGEHSIGGFFMHSTIYSPGADTNYVCHDSTFGRAMRRLKYWEDQGKIWLCTYAELAEWARQNYSCDNGWCALPGQRREIAQYSPWDTTRIGAEVQYTYYNGSTTDSTTWWQIDAHCYSKIAGFFRGQQYADAGTVSVKGVKAYYTPALLRLEQTGEGRVVDIDASAGDGIVIDNSGGKALWVKDGLSSFQDSVNISGKLTLTDTASGYITEAVHAGSADVAADWTAKATKADTNKAIINRQVQTYGRDAMTGSQKKGTTGVPIYAPPDTVKIDEVYFSWYAVGVGWDTCYVHNPTAAVITPDEGWYIHWAEVIANKWLFYVKDDGDSIIAVTPDTIAAATINNPTTIIEYYFLNP